MERNSADDTLSAHIYRNGKITGSVFIKHLGESTYAVLYENELIADAASCDEALDLADLYIRGFLAGYDTGYDDANERRN